MSKIPSLSDIVKDRSQIKKLTTPQLYQLVMQAREALKLVERDGTRVPASPALLAAELSKGNWHNAKHLQMLSEWLVDLEEGKRHRIMVSMPPRHGKSELISYWYPFWLLARNPKRKVILASYEAEFATHWGRRVRNAVIDYGNAYGLELDTSTTAANRWNLTSGGGMFTTGAGGALTGRGADVLIIDDPIKNAEDAASETIREKLWDWFQTTAFTRLEPGGYVVIVGTRWHEDDLIGRLERASQPDETGVAPGLTWDVLKLPAVAEGVDILGRAPGEALWPARFNESALETIKKGNTAYNWSALYQQNPTPEDGGGVKRRWWNYFEVPPAEFDVVIQSWDLAFKDLTTSDYTVGQVWGRKGAQFYLLHQVRGRLNAPEVIQAIRNCTAAHPKAIGKLIEDKANGPAVIATLHREVAGIIPVKVKASKDARLQAILPLIEAGNVYLPGRRRPDGSLEPRSTWVSDFVEEAAAFPNGTYDDQVDAMTQALAYLQPQAWQAINRAWKEAKTGLPASTNEQIQAASFSKEVKKSIRRADNRFREGLMGSGWQIPRGSRW